MKINKKRLTFGAAIASAALIIGAFTLAINHTGSIFSSKANSNIYSLVLNSTNRYDGSSSKDITVASGNATVNFAYTGASVNNSAHVNLTTNGTVKNTEQITSISALTVDFTGSLKARISYDGSTWGDYFLLSDDVKVTLDSNPYYVEIKANSASTINTATYEYTCVPNDSIPSGATGDVLLGVIDFFDAANLEDTGTTTNVNGTWVNSHSFDKVATPRSTVSLVTSVTSSNVYQKRYGGIGMGSNKNNGTMSLTLKNGLEVNKVVVEASATKSGKLGNLSLNDTQKALSKVYSTTMTSITSTYVDSLEWTFNTVPTTLSFTSSKSDYKVALYRIYLYGEGEAMPTPDNPDIYEIGFTASDTNKDTYTTENIFDNDNNLVVRALLSDGNSQLLTSDDYSYVVKNSGGTSISTSAKFPSAGTYTLVVSYKSFIPVEIELSVSKALVLSSINVNLTKLTYNTADKLSDYLSGLTVDLIYTDTSENVSGITYAQFASYDLSLALINPNGVTVSQSTSFGVDGTYTVKVICGSIYGTQDITVEAILVTDITLSETSITLTVGKHAQLTATVGPNNATNKGITWSSTDDAVASVTDGYVTAISAGDAVIKATANDGSNVVGSCNVHVNAIVQNDEWTIVDDASTLSAGDELVIACPSEGVTAGDISNKVMSPLDSAFDSDYEHITTLNTDTVKLTLGGTSGAWTLSNEDEQLLGATANKNLAWDSGVTTWSISIDSQGLATIQNTTSSYGRFLYNSTSPRFTTYTSATSASMLLPCIYRGSVSTPIYPTDFTISGPANNKIAVGETAQLAITYTPTTTNQKYLTFASSNEAVATISSTGLITGLTAGSTTITVKAKKNAEGQYITKTFTLSVNNVAVTGISLTPSSLSLSVGQNSTLTTVISPSNATNKNVTFTSNRTSVATVDSSGKVTAVSAGSATITARTSDGNFTATCSVTVTQQQLTEWTLLFYVCGSNLESDTIANGGGCATSDINEILSVKSSQPSNVKIVLETGGASTWRGNGISANYLERYEISSSGLSRKAQLTKANMGLASTFQSFLEWGFENYPAKKYGVFMWNHGGAMDGCCYDENFDDDSLTANEVDSAISTARTNKGISNNLEFIAYDACLMAVQDIAEVNSHHFNYMICSQESEYSGGYDYDMWLPTLYNNPAGVSTLTVLSKIGDTFMDEQEANFVAWQEYYGYDQVGECDQTQSVLDLSKMAAYKTAWENMASGLSGIITTSSKWNSFANTVYSCQKYGYYSDYNIYPYDIYDVAAVMAKLEASSTYSTIKTKVQAVESALGDVVVYERHGLGITGCGLNLFCPIEGYTNKSSYQAQTNFTNWYTLVAKYGEWY